MQINITHERNEDGPDSGPVKVGWFLSDTDAPVIYDAPTRVRGPEMNRKHAKSASRCPAVINLESRYFQVNCPFDLHLGFDRDDKGKPVLRNLLGDNTPVRRNKLNALLTVTSESEWRYPDRPTIQIMLPYILISDEPVYMAQVPPFFHYNPEPWPGTLFGGRFPIDVWPRPLMWAFEWHDVKKPLRLKRGEPMFYCHFEVTPQDRPVQMVEAERTPELDAYVKHISGAVNYVNQTFSLFKAAQDRRPEKLLVPREKG